MRIYLIGYMGSGKSTLGNILAREMGLTFIDLDKYIEERNYRTVPQLFAELGEPGFRERERKALEEISEFTGVVIATGGGAPCFYDNMELMNRSGITVFLDIHPSVLADRLLKSKTERPLIQGKSRTELIRFIDESLKSRMPFYSKARIRIEKTHNITASLKEEIHKIL